MNNKIRFDHDTTVFEEALPIGNGSFGAMVWGTRRTQKLSLNSDTFWTGTVGSDVLNENRVEKIKKHRELIEQKRFVEAEEQALNELNGSRYSALYIPVGDILIEKFGPGETVDCYRELDLETATVTEKYKYEYEQFGYQSRRAFITKKEDVLVDEIKTERPMSFVVSFKNHLKKRLIEYADGIGVVCSAPENTYGKPILEDAENTVSLGLVIKVATDGEVEIYNNEIFIYRAKNIAVLAACETNFVDYKTIPDKNKDLLSAASAKIEKALLSGIDAIYENHVKEHQKLYNRMSLSLPAQKKDEFFAEYERENPTNELVELMFNFGRYLLIASSSKGTQPANLQGIWNENFVPNWFCGYTVNINLEMNYWLAEPANLSECHEPLMKMLEEISEAGRVAAREYYDCDGWVAHHNIDLWRKCGTAQGAPQHSIWPMGSGWLCQHLWTHYIYTMDKEFLKNKAYPITREAVRFYLDFLYEDKDGYLVTIPSVSPENGYNVDGNRVAVTKMSAMDRCIITELFENFICMSDILGENELAEETKTALARLSPFKIGSKGQLLEWDEEFEECEPRHRHLSHLYGIYPGNVLLRDEKLRNAARISLDHRLKNGGGHTGWSCGWIILLLASFKDSEGAKKYIERLLKKSSYPNLFDLHPPFQIDGNFAFTAGILHMLVQGKFENGQTVIDLLPACPEEWHTGKISGVCVPGGITLDMEWNKDGASLKLNSSEHRKVKIMYRDKEITETVCGEKQIVL